MNGRQRLAGLRTAFQTQFGGEPEIWLRAPGRVDLMGSHTDYNDGFVLTLPIDRDTWIAGQRRDDGGVNVFSLNVESPCRFSIGDPAAASVQGWGRYIYGVAQTMRHAGYPVGGFNAVIHGTVPIASGLSSSASLEAATATLLEQLGGFQIPLVEKARLCQRAENEIVGVNCGILDQYSSILGEAGAAILLDCRRLTHQQSQFPRGLRVVICNTGAPRGLAGSAYGERRASCERAARTLAAYDSAIRALRDVPLNLFEEHAAELDPVDARRARFILQENDRVHQLAAALAGDNRQAIGRLTAESFAGARDLFEISIPAMQAMFDSMTAAPGVAGARQAGAGFGGCMVAFVQSDAVEAFCEAVSASYAKATGIVPDVYPVHPAAGAGTLELPHD